MAFFVSAQIFEFFKTETSSPGGISGKKPVNNSSFKLSEQSDSIGGFELFAGYSRGVFSGQPVHINSLSVWEFQL
jgi:hypothetical protein